MIFKSSLWQSLRKVPHRNKELIAGLVPDDSNVMVFPSKSGVREMQRRDGELLRLVS